MQYSGNFSGSTPYIVKYKLSATGLAAGAIVCASPDASSGEIIVTAATATANQMGVCLDAADSRTGETLISSTTQGNAAGAYSVIAVFVGELGRYPIPASVYLAAVLFSGATGVLAGYAPAQVAARANIVDALRHE